MVEEDAYFLASCSDLDSPAGTPGGSQEWHLEAVAPVAGLLLGPS